MSPASIPSTSSPSPVATAAQPPGDAPPPGGLGPERGGLLAGEPVVWTGQLLALVTPDGAAGG